MARHNRLRTPKDERPAKAGLLAVRQSVSPVHLAAILAIVAASFLTVWQLADVGGARPIASKDLTRALGEPQSPASLVQVPAPELRVPVEARSLHPRFNPDTDLRLLPVALLTLGANITSAAGLGRTLKKAGSGFQVEVGLGGSAFPVPYAVDPLTGLSALTTNVIAGERKVLDLSRPTRAGPGGAHAIHIRASASSSSDPDSGLQLGGV
jgi:hypothetical protein